MLTTSLLGGDIIIIIPILQIKNQGTESLGNLPNVIQLLSFRAGIQTQVVELQEPVLLASEQHSPWRMKLGGIGVEVVSFSCNISR